MWSGRLFREFPRKREEEGRKAKLPQEGEKEKKRRENFFVVTVGSSPCSSVNGEEKRGEKKKKKDLYSLRGKEEGGSKARHRLNSGLIRVGPVYSYAVHGRSATGARGRIIKEKEEEEKEREGKVLSI